MEISFRPTFNSVVMILIGIGLMLFGAWLVLNASGRMFAIGFFFTGIGNIIFGLTNGFTDMSPFGQKLFRFALAAYIIGVPIIGYFLYTEMR